MSRVLLARALSVAEADLEFFYLSASVFQFGAGGGGVAGRYHAARFHEMLEFWMLSPGSCVC